MDVQKLLLKEMELSHVSGRIKSCTELLATAKLALDIYIREENNSEILKEKMKEISFLLQEAEEFIQVADHKLLDYEGLLADLTLTSTNNNNTKFQHSREHCCDKKTSAN